jgi:hypothetical protein
MANTWRVLIHLQSEEAAEAVTSRIEAHGLRPDRVGDGVVLTLAGRRARARVLRTARAAVHEAGVHAVLESERWNPKWQRWTRSSASIRRSQRREVKDIADMRHPDDCEYEVIDKPFLPRRAAWLAEKARTEGWTALSSGAELRVLAADDDELADVIAWLKSVSFFGSNPTVHRLGFFRHWLWRERLFGNYAGPDPTAPR